MIDVSQSVETSHNKAFEFLRRDTAAVSQFFTKRGVPDVLSSSDLFKFITDITIEDQRLATFLQQREEEQTVDPQ
jgi:serine/threonine-protein kinase RIO1